MAILSPDKLVPRANLAAYEMDPNRPDWGDLLAPFSPPLPREGAVISASYFGDVFVEDKDGGIWWVNGMEERVDRAALSRDQLRERLASDHFIMLKTKLLEALIVQNKLLPTGMLYGLKVPRSEGGTYNPDNLGTAPIVDAFAYMGSLFRKKHPLPSQPPPAAPEPKKKSGFWGKKK
jgi:hypothetical protein